MTATGMTYGDALYELAADEALTDELLEQVKLLGDLFRQNPRYLALLATPDIPLEERLRLIGKALSGQVHPYLVNFLRLLCQRGRLPAYYDCATRFEQRWLEAHNTVKGRVTSAVPLSEEQLSALSARMGRHRSGSRRRHCPCLRLGKMHDERTAGIPQRGIRHSSELRGKYRRHHHFG